MIRIKVGLLIVEYPWYAFPRLPLFSRTPLGDGADFFEVGDDRVDRADIRIVEINGG